MNILNNPSDKYRNYWYDDVPETYYRDMPTLRNSIPRIQIHDTIQNPIVIKYYVKLEL